MHVEFLTSTADLRRVQKQMRRRVVRMKFEDHDVQVTCCSGIFKARFAGGADVGFGETPSEATQRLHKLPNMVRFVSIKSCDVYADRVEAAAERAAAKAAKRSER